MPSSSFFVPSTSLSYARTNKRSLQPPTFSRCHFTPLALSHLAHVARVRTYFSCLLRHSMTQAPAALFFTILLTPMACDLFSFYLIWIYFSLSQCFGIYLTWSECWAAFKLTTMPNTNYTSATRSYFSFRKDTQRSHRTSKRLWMAHTKNQYFLTDAFQIKLNKKNVEWFDF